MNNKIISTNILTLNGQKFVHLPTNNPASQFAKCYDCNEVSDILSCNGNKCPTCAFGL